MPKDFSASELGIDIKDYVATVEIRRPPLNFFDFELIREIADVYEALDERDDVRSIMLCADGKAFCAGADFSSRSDAELESDDAPGEKSKVDDEGVQHLYVEATRIFDCKKPTVACVHGAAIGGGLGLAISADFRVASPEARFAANFTRLGFHPGFGLTHTLPLIVGLQNAKLIFMTSRRFTGEDAFKMGLADVLVPASEVRQAAWDLAREIAINSPLGTVSTRATMRQGLAKAVKAATDHELEEQVRLRKTKAFKEGVRATAAREIPNFIGA